MNEGIEDRQRNEKRGGSGKTIQVKESSGALWRNSVQEHVRICSLGTAAPQVAWESKDSSKHRFRCLLRVGISAYCSRSTVPFSLKPKHPSTKIVIPSEATSSPAPGSCIH